jgi:3D (Asp-Asp-Asp) domain-containing protein
VLLTRSLRRRIVVAASAALAFALMYESRIFDAQYIPSAFRRTRAETPVLQPGPPDPQDVAPPAPGVRLRFRATAYCKGTTTASGAGIQTGIAAADPDLLPVGSVIRVESLGQRYNGIYTILDTGPRVKGRQIDIYMWNCNEALAFGRRTISLSVMRLGWNPRTSTPERVGTEFRRREAQIGGAPATPTPPASTSPSGPPATGPATPPSGGTVPGTSAPTSPAEPQRAPGAATAGEPRETGRPSTAS